jgi:hypothetical protein
MALGGLGYWLAFAAASASHSPDQKLEARLTAMEKASWAAWQNMDVPFWEDFLSDDHIELNAFVGPVGKAVVIGGIAKKVCKVRNYKVDRFTFRRLDENTAILVFRAVQVTSCGSVTVPFKELVHDNAVSSVRCRLDWLDRLLAAIVRTKT